MSFQKEKLTDLLTTGTMQNYTITKKQTVQILLKKLGLDGKVFAILVDGKAAGPEEIIEKNQEIVILPKIAGGT